MADVELRNGKWSFRFVDPVTGKRKLKTTTARNKTEAREIMRAFLVQQERVEVGIEKANPNPRGWTVRQLLEWWLDEFNSQLAAAETDRQSVTKHLLVGPFSELRLERVTSVEVARFLHQKGKEPSRNSKTGGTLSAQTINHLRAYISRAFTKARKQGIWIGDNPVREVEKRKVEEPLPVFLTKDEVRAVLAAAAEHQPQWAGLYACAFYTGLRKGELFALRWTDIDWANSIINVQRSHDRSTTKGRRGRVVDIPDELVPFLEAQKRLNTKNVFPNPEGGQWIKDTRIDQRFAEALKNAEIERKLRFHDTRDTFASLFLMNNGSIVALQELLGHRSIETTRKRYGHISRDYVRAQMKGFSMGAPTTPPANPVRTTETRRKAAHPGTQLCAPRRRASNG